MLSVPEGGIEVGEAETFIQFPDERCECGSGSYLDRRKRRDVGALLVLSATEEPLRHSLRPLSLLGVTWFGMK